MSRVQRAIPHTRLPSPRASWVPKRRGWHLLSGLRESKGFRERLGQMVQKVPKVRVVRRVILGTQAIPHTRSLYLTDSRALKVSGSTLSWEKKAPRGHKANRALAGLRASRAMMETTDPPESRVSVARRVIRAILARREIREQRVTLGLAALLA